MHVIDLSADIVSSPEGTPDFAKTVIDYHSHDDGAEQAQALLKVPASCFRNGEGWANETIKMLGTHNSTHVDAPWHYNSEIQGERALTIDELPLEWFFQDGVMIDMQHKADGDAVTIEDIQSKLSEMDYQIKPLDIVLICTGRDVNYNELDYMFKGPGVTAKATKWLYDQGVRVTGIDAWGWDRPLNMQAMEAGVNPSKSTFWEAHQADLQYAHIERMVNLKELPSKGFKVACFPLKIKGASAGPCRAVAIL